MNLEKDISPWEELRRWRETWKYYNKLVDEGYYTPSEYDSSQTRDTILTTISDSYTESLSEEETWERIVRNTIYDYESAREAEKDIDDISTSSLINKGIDLGPSD